MKYAYPAVFTPEKEGGFGITVPDLPSCFTCGNDLVDAYQYPSTTVHLLVEELRR